MSTVSAQPLITNQAAADDAAALARLTDAERLQIHRKRSVVSAWRDLIAEFRRENMSAGDATGAYLAQNPGLTRSRLYALAALVAVGDPLALLDGRRNNGGHRRAETPACGDAAWAYFCRFYLRAAGPTIKDCWMIVWAEAQNHAGDAAWSWPKLRTLQQRVRTDPATKPQIADFVRLGPRTWDKRYGMRAFRDYDSYRSNQVWNGDGHPIDVFCRLSPTDDTIVRPTLCSFQDLRSRMIVGWNVATTETQDSILFAFRMGVERHSPPERIVVDNGKSYRAKGLSGGKQRASRILDDPDYVASVFGACGVEPRFCIIRNPDSKPVEGWHGVFESQLGKAFATYCGGDASAERFKDAWKRAQSDPMVCPTVDEISGFIGRYLEAYHLTPHSGRGMTDETGRRLCPAEAFAHFNPIARRVVAPEVLDVLLMRVYTGPSKDGTPQGVTVTRNGVRYRGVQYGNQELSPGSPLFDMLGTRVFLRIHPTDASFVVVCSMDGKRMCRARNALLEATGVNGENVAEAQRRRNAARRTMRKIHEGALDAANESIADLAIQARLDYGHHLRNEQLATGTDDRQAAGQVRSMRPTALDLANAGHRNLRPMPHDWTESVEQMSAQVDRPLSIPDLPTIEDLPEDDEDRPLEIGLPVDEPGELPDWEDDE